MFGSAASGVPFALHLLEGGERGQQAGAVVGADRGDVELGEPLRRPRAAVTPASVSAPSSKVISATIGRLETLRTALMASTTSSRS